MPLIDWIIVVLFLLTLTGIGFYFSGKNRNIEDYFVAGRAMPAGLVALAATGTSISAGTFVGSPELGFNTNLTFLMSCVGAVIGGIFVAWLVLPKLYNANTITIYGYIGDRFGDTAKRYTSVMFLFGQLFTSGSRLFIAAIAISVIIFGGIDFQFIVISIIILGIVSTIYTMVGGIKGLLYIDAFQILLVVGTGVLTLYFVFSSLDMSLSEIVARLSNGMVKLPAQPEYGMAPDGTMTGWGPDNKLKLIDPRFDITKPYNLAGALIAYAIFKFAQFSTDHEFVQRQLTCKSVKTAGTSLVYSQLMAIPIVFVFLSIGLLLYVKFSADPVMGAASGFFTDARDVFPQYIKNSIPTGIRGLMIVGLLAAALSSFNSAINAMASSFVTDLYLPIRKEKGREVVGNSEQIASSKKMAALMGAILTAFAIVTAVMQQASGLNLVDFATGVMCFSYAGMLGVFIVALYTKRGNTKSVVAALFAGLLVVLLLQPYILTPLSNALFGKTVFIAWPWWCPIGATVSTIICLLGKPEAPVVLGVGEIVWDMLPSGKQLGGAPINFCYFAMKEGAEAYPISAIGKDDLGEETLSTCHMYGINTSYLRKNELPTSRVNVSLDKKGNPQYEIVNNVAWDGFVSNSRDLMLASRADCVCWGSLAQRNPDAGKNFLKIIDATGKNCLKVFDINIRQKYYSKEVIESSLERADILKLNEDELPLVLEITGCGSIKELVSKYNLKYIIHTCGASFSEVFDSSGMVSHIDTPKVTVEDTVGAGDSFTAVFVTMLLKGSDIKECHSRAVEVSAKVCTQRGAINN